MFGSERASCLLVTVDEALQHRPPGSFLGATCCAGQGKPSLVPRLAATGKHRAVAEQGLDGAPGGTAVGVGGPLGALGVSQQRLPH